MPLREGTRGQEASFGTTKPVLHLLCHVLPALRKLRASQETLVRLPGTECKWGSHVCGGAGLLGAGGQRKPPDEVDLAEHESQQHREREG